MNWKCKLLGHDFGVGATIFTYVGSDGRYVCKRCGIDINHLHK